MKMTLKNKYTLKLRKLYEEAEKLGYIPNTIELTNEELYGLLEELCEFKNYNDFGIQYSESVAFKGFGGASLSSAFLQYRPKELSELITEKKATLFYHNDIPFVVIKRPSTAPDIQP